MQHPDSAAAQRHAHHDTLLIAGLAAGDLIAADRLRADALLADCADCRSLRDDLIAIAAATRALPATRAPRDFRLSADQAARLQRRGWLATLLAPLSRAGSASRPIATAFTTLGLAGVFVATMLAGFGGATAAGPGLAGGGAASAPEAASPAPGAPFGPAAASGAPGDVPGPKDAAESPGSAIGNDGIDTSRGGESTDTGRQAESPRPANLLLTGSLGLLAAGLALFGLRYASRRLR